MRSQRQDHTDSCVVSSDDEELSRDRDVYVTTHAPRSARDESTTRLRYPYAPCTAGFGGRPGAGVMGPEQVGHFLSPFLLARRRLP